MKNIMISFITINYNSASFTLKLIESIIRYTNVRYEIIVVDNASNKEDRDYLEQKVISIESVQLIKSSVNGGFASGNMLGAAQAKGKYLFFINNDAKLLNSAGDIMLKYLLKHQNIALATAKIEDHSGKFSSSYKLFPSVIKELFGNSIARFFSKHKFPSNKVILNQPTKVEVVSGSCMFFRASDFFFIGGFDTNFFLYCEEEDISKRIWDSGKEVFFLPEAKIFHHSGGSTQKSFEIEREYYISYFYLIKKHFSYFSYAILRFLVLLKLFRRSFKRKNGWRLFLCSLKGCSKRLSLKVKV